MSFETIFIHVLWASVSYATLYVAYRCAEKHTTVKSLEAFALASERVGAVMFHVLKASEGRIGSFRLPNGTHRQDHPTPAQA